MKIILMKPNKLENFILPTKINGNYWIFDYDVNNNKRNLVNIVANDGKWILKDNPDVRIIYNGQDVHNVVLNLFGFYVLKLMNESFLLYVSPIIEDSLIKLEVKNNTEYIVGNKNTDIIFGHGLIKDNHLKLEYKNNIWMVSDIAKSKLLYVNDINVESSALKYGDVIFLCGLKIIVMKDYVYLNQIANAIKFNNRFNILNNELGKLELDDFDEDKYVKPLYVKDDYFYKSPRFKSLIEKEDLNIDAPPSKVEEKQMPTILTIGPMITMSLTSVVFTLSSISNMVANGNKNVWAVFPSIIMAVTMLTSCILWPSLIRKYERKQRIKHEKERQEKYRKYIDEKREKINLMMKMQTQILKDNYLSASECNSIILNKKSNLWNRKVTDDDFLSLRVGVGDFPLDISVRYREEDFMMEEDELKMMAKDLVNETRNLVNVPISYSFKDNFVSGIIGTENLVRNFLNYMILQIATFYAYNDVKIQYTLLKKIKTISTVGKEGFTIYNVIGKKRERLIKKHDKEHEKALKKVSKEGIIF